MCIFFMVYKCNFNLNRYTVIILAGITIDFLYDYNILNEYCCGKTKGILYALFIGL